MRKVLIHGKCHCSNISFTLKWEPEPSVIPARICTCTFCVKHAGVWTSCSGGSLRVFVDDPSLVTRYEFGTKTAQFHVCSRCGVVPVVTSVIDGHAYAVVNVHALEGVDPALIRHSTADFEGEGKDARLDRRKHKWIAKVEFVTGEA